MCRKKNYSIDVLDMRYVHVFCCSSHVTTSAQRIAYLSLCSLIIRSLLLIFHKHWSFSIGVSTFIDFLCIVALALSILDEITLLSIPFLIHQAYYIFMIAVELSLWIMDVYLQRNTSENAYLITVRENSLVHTIVNDFVDILSDSVSAEILNALVVLMLSGWIFVSMYFWKIIANFVLYLKRNRLSSRLYQTVL